MSSAGGLAAVPRTRRGWERREAVLDAAAELFREHGFHGTSVDDLGAAAGITGPGLYRHFRSKDALLMAVLDRLWERLKPALRLAEDQPPRGALDVLIEAHLDLALGQPAALVLLVRELRHLPEEYRSAARRNHRRYLDAWVAPLRRLAPHLDAASARAAALAVHGMIDSAALFPGVLPPSRHRELLRGLAEATLARIVAGEGNG